MSVHSCSTPSLQSLGGQTDVATPGLTDYQHHCTSENRLVFCTCPYIPVGITTLQPMPMPMCRTSLQNCLASVLEGLLAKQYPSCKHALMYRCTIQCQLQQPRLKALALISRLTWVCPRHQQHLQSRSPATPKSLRIAFSERAQPACSQAEALSYPLN